MDPQDERGRALEALSLMRRKGLSLAAASREAETTPKQVHRWVGRALTQRGGRWKAKPWDRIPRRLRMVDELRGPIEVEARDSRTATRIARYNAAARRYLFTGDDTALQEFRGQSFRSQGLVYHYLTDTDEIERLALVGEVQFEDMYADAA